MELRKFDMKEILTDRIIVNLLTDFCSSFQRTRPSRRHFQVLQGFKKPQTFFIFGFLLRNTRLSLHVHCSHFVLVFLYDVRRECSAVWKNQRNLNANYESQFTHFHHDSSYLRDATSQEKLSKEKWRTASIEHHRPCLLSLLDSKQARLWTLFLSHTGSLQHFPIFRLSRVLFCISECILHTRRKSQQVVLERKVQIKMRKFTQIKFPCTPSHTHKYVRFYTNELINFSHPNVNDENQLIFQYDTQF
jgi:hypothetical protein